MPDRGGIVGDKSCGGDFVASRLEYTAAPARQLPTMPRLEDKTVGAWNTKKLSLRVSADALAAASAGFLVAPIITIIDRGIIENAAGKRTLGASVKSSLRTLLLRPHNFFFSRPFALIFTLYTGTYLSANTIDTASSTLRNHAAHTTTHGTAKFAATSAANLSLCLWKDAHFTKLFSPIAPRPVPKTTFLLFALRDSMTIAASFNLPPILAPHIPTEALPEIMRGIRKESYAQFIAPAAIQVFSTPMHLLGLDFYNRNGNTPLADRWAMVRKAWAISTFARLARIIPAFGVGGVVNASVRRNCMDKIELLDA